MNGFCPDGYMPTREAIVRAAEYWFPERIAALERAAAPQSETKADNSSEALARALSQPLGIPDALRHEFSDIVNQTVHRLRNLLHQGELTAYYFGGLFGDGRHAVSSGFWATTAADGVMESGTYWPFGKPTRWYESRPNYSLFLLQSELDALLSEQPAKKRPLPKAKMPELVAALRKLDDLPNRRAQFQALCDMPEFREFKITDVLFREAARQVPRDAGRKSRR
jgi:hypothetical protein